MEKSSFYEQKRTSFDYLGSEAADHQSGIVGAGGHGGGDVGVDCLAAHHALRPHHHQPAAGPFHYLISEQAKSLVALQELQHEVGALLEFRDLVMETFPNLRTKLAQLNTSTSPATVTVGHHHHHSNIPISVRPGEWTPGVRVRKKLITNSGSKDKKSSDSTSSTTAIQDSGFSTEASSKETHSASSTAPLPSTSGHEMQHETASSGELDDIEDELWNLLDIIHRKGTRLKEEAELLQGTLREQVPFQEECDEVNFERVLFHSSADDVRHLRQERDLLLERLAELEAEVLAGQIHTSRLQEDLDHLLSAKQDLEDQLKAIATHRGEVNSRIHDLHSQFVTKNSGSNEDKQKTVSGSSSSAISKEEKDNNSSQVKLQTNLVNSDGGLDDALGDRLPKVPRPDSKKIAAILKEQNPLALKKHLLVSTVQNQVLRQRLDSIGSTKVGLRDQLDKAREENEDLRFQLEDKTIELEGTKARVRLLEDLHKPNLNKSTSPDIIPDLDVSQGFRTSSRIEISTPSMKAMTPFPMNPDHTSSTESAHDMTAESNKSSTGSTKRRPSKIPLKSYTAPKPPIGKHSPAQSRSRSGDSPHRSHSAHSVRHRSSDSVGGGGTPSLTKNSLPKSRNSSLISARDSLTSKLRSTEAVPNSKSSPVVQKKSGTSTGRWSKDEKVRPKSGSSIWSFFVRRDV